MIACSQLNSADADDTVETVAAPLVYFSTGFAEYHIRMHVPAACVRAFVNVHRTKTSIGCHSCCQNASVLIRLFRLSITKECDLSEAMKGDAPLYFLPIDVIMPLLSNLRKLESAQSFRSDRRFETNFKSTKHLYCVASRCFKQIHAVPLIHQSIILNRSQSV